MRRQRKAAEQRRDYPNRDVEQRPWRSHWTPKVRDAAKRSANGEEQKNTHIGKLRARLTAPQDTRPLSVASLRLPFDDVKFFAHCRGAALQPRIAPGQNGVNLSNCRGWRRFGKSALLSFPAFVIVGGGMFGQCDLRYRIFSATHLLNVAAAGFVN